MVSINWTAQAIQDLDDIASYIARDSIKYACLVTDELFSAPDVLENTPLAGRVVPEFQDGNLRELIRGSYRIVYSIVSSERIDVLTVHHCARLLAHSPVFKSTRGRRFRR